MDSQDRITALESRLAHFEKMAEDMSDVLARQDRIIDRLSLQLRQMAERLSNVEPGLDRSPQDDKPPPHW